MRNQIRLWLLNHPKVNPFSLRMRFTKFIISSGGNRIEYLKERGWKESFVKKQAITQKGSPIPWYSYPVLDFLKQTLKNNLKIFEYGAGNSTLWWVNYASELIVCEHEKEWIKKIGTLPANMKIIHRNLDEGYSELIKDYHKYFHIVVIDGRKRNKCIENSIDSLLPDGIIILDDSNLDKYIDGCNFLASLGFKKIDFYGMGPISPITQCTSIFYRSGNILGI